MMLIAIAILDGLAEIAYIIGVVYAACHFHKWALLFFLVAVPFIGRTWKFNK